MNILATNTALSGMCDRVVDLFLLATLSKVLNKKLYYVWKEAKSFSEHQLKTWNAARFEDYKLENFTQYFDFPETINFVSESELETLDRGKFNLFDDYLGGIYSPKTFHALYCQRFCSYETFEAQYQELVSQLKPTEKLKKLVQDVPRISISVHLRRGDKITQNPDIVQIHANELESLNQTTKQCIDELMKNNQKQTVYFCSDTISSKEEFEKDYQDKNCLIIQQPPNLLDIEKTYVDLYLLSQSKNIVLSQKHSNFSVFASQINRVRLFYFFKDNDMIKNGNFKNAVLFDSTIATERK